MHDGGLQPCPHSLPRSLFGRLVVLSVAAALLTIAVDWGNYYAQWRHLDVAMPPATLLTALWMLLAKNLLSGLAILLLSGIADALRYPRVGSVVFYLLLAVWCFGWVADSGLYRQTTFHLLHYAVFITGPSAAEWAGGWGMIAGPVGRWLATTVLVLGPAIALGAWIDRGWLRRRRTGWPGAVSALAACVVVAIVPWLLRPNPDGVLYALRQSLPWAGRAAVQDAPFNRALDEAVASEASGVAALFTEAAPIQIATSAEPWRRPHVVVIAVESWRYEALRSDVMPRLSRLAADGAWVWDRHYTGANASQLGLFSLLYGRWPANYYATLDAHQPPPTTRWLAELGYQTHFYTSSVNDDWARMGEFLNDRNFDEKIDFVDGDWPARDKALLRRVADQIKNADSPRFVLAFLSSTHFPYLYPSEAERFKPVAELREDFFTFTPDDRERLLNRYYNAAGYLDGLIAELIDAVEGEDCIFVITGDHGESLFDDGTLSHVTLASDIQVRTPMLWIGKDLPAGGLDAFSSHADFLPTLTHLITGEPGPVSGLHGQSRLVPPVDDYVFVFPLQAPGPRYTFVLIKPHRRLRFNVELTSPSLRLLGELNDRGRFVSRPAPLAEVAGWQETVADVARRAFAGREASSDSDAAAE